MVRTGLGGEHLGRVLDGREEGSRGGGHGRGQAGLPTRSSSHNHFNPPGPATVPFRPSPPPVTTPCLSSHLRRFLLGGPSLLPCCYNSVRSTHHHTCFFFTLRRSVLFFSGAPFHGVRDPSPISSAMHRANRQRVSNPLPSDRLRTLPRHLSLRPPASQSQTHPLSAPAAGISPSHPHPSVPSHIANSLSFPTQLVPIQSPPPLILPSRHLILRCQLTPMFLYITPLGPLHNRPVLASPGLSCHLPHVTTLTTANAGPRPIVSLPPPIPLDALLARNSSK